MALKNTLTPKRFRRLLEKHSLIDIARKHHVSKQYISQLYSKYKEMYPSLFEQQEITKEWLVDALEKHTIKEICEITGTSYHHIKKLMSEFDVEKPTTRRSFDRAYIYEQYVVCCRSDEQIAEDYGCSASLVKKFRYKHGIRYEDRVPLAERLTRELAATLMDEGYSIEQLSKKFDATPYRVRRVLLSYGFLS